VALQFWSERKFFFALLLAAVIGLTLRCAELPFRPMHNDEAVNAIKLRALMEQGTYRYDSNEHHGPTLYYAALAWAKLTGASDFSKITEARLRSVIVVFGIGLILLLPLVSDGLGRGATVCAALLTAISPAMVFYSDDFIHEMLLVFFTFFALASFWRFYRDGNLGWAALAGAGFGLMSSTKETFVLTLVAIAVALLANKFWTRSGDTDIAARRKVFAPIFIGLIAWAAVAVIFFTSFFSNAHGLLDALRTYQPWMNRAAGHSPHVHPWDFYFERLIYFPAKGGAIWSEGFIAALAVVGIIAAFTSKKPADAKANFLRFVAFYTITLAAIYSAIAYKTPWCLLNFWHGAILLAGVGMVTVWRIAFRFWQRAIVAILFLCSMAHLAFQSWQAGTTFSADRRNPYVYAQTSSDVFELTRQIEALARASGEGHRVMIKVIASDSDYWPLPWYLRNFEQVGWWSELPENPWAPIIIASNEFAPRLDENKALVRAGFFELRPGVFVALYVESDLWQKFLNSRATTPVM
jgi:uncharacterized protein (TIGR03663 family)